MCGNGVFLTEPRRWICFNYNEGIKVVAISSIISGIFIIGISSWYLHHFLISQTLPTIDEKNELYYRTSYLVRNLELYFPTSTGAVGSTSTLIINELDTIIQVLILTSATALAFSILQVLVNLWLIWAALTDQFYLIGLWFLAQLSIIIAIGSAYLVLLVNQIEFTYIVHLFFAMTIVELLILTYFSWLLFCFSDGKNNKKCINCCTLLWDFEKVIWIDVTNKTTQMSMV